MAGIAYLVVAPDVGIQVEVTNVDVIVKVSMKVDDTPMDVE